MDTGRCGTSRRGSSDTYPLTTYRTWLEASGLRALGLGLGVLGHNHQVCRYSCPLPKVRLPVTFANSYGKCFFLGRACSHCMRTWCQAAIPFQRHVLMA